MPPRSTVTMVLVAVLITHGIKGLAQGSPVNGSDELVGRWALIAAIIDGEDVTKGGVTQAGEVVHYTFNADRTFVLALGDSVRETGTWSTDPTVSPKIFDHTWHSGTDPNPTVRGIYESGGGFLKISMLPPTAASRPTRFESKAANGSRIYIFRRVAE